jgi:hypothetical protein
MRIQYPDPVEQGNVVNNSSDYHNLTINNNKAKDKKADRTT